MEQDEKNERILRHFILDTQEVVDKIQGELKVVAEEDPRYLPILEKRIRKKLIPELYKIKNDIKAGRSIIPL